jgi:serine/threonine protein kinase
MTTTSEHAGTIRYLAPELVASDVSVPPTLASDMYALGCLGLQVRRQGPFPDCGPGFNQRDTVYLSSSPVLKPLEGPTRDHDTPGPGSRPATRECTTTPRLAFSSYLATNFRTVEPGSFNSPFCVRIGPNGNAHRVHTS